MFNMMTQPQAMTPPLGTNPAALKVPKVKVSFDARAADIGRLDAQAFARQLTRADLIREALTRYLADAPGTATSGVNATEGAAHA